MYEFDDEFGHHEHEIRPYDSAYDHKAKITCKACIKRLTLRRQLLCRKHKWSFWPDSCSVGF